MARRARKMKFLSEEWSLVLTDQKSDKFGKKRGIGGDRRQIPRLEAMSGIKRGGNKEQSNGNVCAMYELAVENC